MVRCTGTKCFVDVAELVDEETEEILLLLGFVAEECEDEVHGLSPNVRKGIKGEGLPKEQSEMDMVTI